MKIVSITVGFPFPANTGAAIRVMNILKGLSRHNQVDLVALVREPVDEQSLEEAKKLCSCVHTVQWQGVHKLPRLLGAALRLLVGEPLLTKNVRSTQLRALLKSISRDETYDVVMVEHIDMARYGLIFKRVPESMLVLSLHNVSTILYERQFRNARSVREKLRAALSWIPLRSWEPRMTRKYDLLVTMSETDRRRLVDRRVDTPVVVAPNGVDTETFQPIPLHERAQNILFVGAMDYAPNVDAVLYFAQEILGSISPWADGTRLTIVGRNPTQSVAELGSDPRITVTGEVPSTIPYYREAMVAVVPLRSGGGTRLKILEAMALGTPLVTTSIGCEGIDLEHERHALVADDPKTFGERIGRLLSDAALWERLSREGRALAENSYDWAAIADRLNRDIHQAIDKERVPR